ncbi:MAG: DUF2293 domain-containing protein [Myxococcota bacterium]
MPDQNRTVRFAVAANTVVDETSGATLEVPAGWTLLKPGDAGLTRRVKAAGPTWTVVDKVGRRVFTYGVYALAETVERERAVLEEERKDPAYAKKLEAAKARREKKQEAYVEDFRGAVLAFLGFHPQHAELAGRLADAVTTHATPVGSGTVARTQRIPVEERAEAAVIAWMRHQTTAYDDLHIARVKGERRKVRRMLAERSRRVLDRYRRTAAPPPSDCPLAAALS